jgi:hypothetical protein
VKVDFRFYNGVKVSESGGSTRATRVFKLVIIILCLAKQYRSSKIQPLIPRQQYGGAQCVTVLAKGEVRLRGTNPMGSRASDWQALAGPRKSKYASTKVSLELGVHSRCVIEAVTNSNDLMLLNRWSRRVESKRSAWVHVASNKRKCCMNICCLLLWSP